MTRLSICNLLPEKGLIGVKIQILVDLQVMALLLKIRPLMSGNDDIVNTYELEQKNNLCD